MMEPVVQHSVSFSQHFDFDDEVVPNASAESEEGGIEKERWDEGGRSDCGYSDTLHDTLMTLGSWMHSLFGEPSEELDTHMKGIGNYFQEASYAVRDFKRGTLEKGEFNFKTDDLDLEDDDEEEEVY